MNVPYSAEQIRDAILMAENRGAQQMLNALGSFGLLVMTEVPTRVLTRPGGVDAQVLRREWEQAMGR